MTTTDSAFQTVLRQLEERALEIQLEHFGIPPEQRGRTFYAMETVGEMGELINDCKKYIRTTLAHRRDEQIRSCIPEEAADTLIALMLVKLAARDRREARPAARAAGDERTVAWLHKCLSRLACEASQLYAEEAQRADGGEFDLARYEAIVAELRGVASYFEFALADATHAKLVQIITKVQNGYYD